jgi:predicted metal-dependent hydrolase
MPTEPAIRIKRSAARKRTISARLIDGGATIEVLAPASATDAELAPIIERLKQRIQRREVKREFAEHPERNGVESKDAALARRAQELNREYFEGKLRPSEVRYVTNQNTRYGSCTPATGVVRISHRVAAMPAWVRDYVLVHELAHLKEPNHGPRFWKLVNRYPKTERARGYLIAIGLEGEADESPATDLGETEESGAGGAA